MKTTDKLLDAAEYRMRRGGYNAVSFRDLAEDTKIKSSSVHYHYPKKEDLGVALIQRYSEKFFSALEKKAQKASTVSDKLKAFQSIYKTALVNDDAICLCGLLGAEMGGLPHPLTEGIQLFFDRNIKWIEAVLPDTMTKSERYKSASAIVAGHQGAMMLATSMQDNKVFVTVTDKLLKNFGQVA